MAKRSGQKLRLLYLYRIMLEQTDSSSGITLTAISRELEKYGIRAERKTLYDDIEMLRLYGADIKTHRSRGVKYSLCARPISPLVAKLISDTLNSSGLVSEKHRTDLLSKLVFVGGKNIRELIDEKTDDHNNCDRDLFINLEVLCDAIASDSCVSCRCFLWNSRKQRIMEFDGEYLRLSPWRLILSDRPTLIAYEHSSKRILKLRADRLLNVEHLTLAREGRDAFREFEQNSRVENPKEVMLRFRCANSAADEVITRFGTDITVSNNTEEYFEFSVKAFSDDELFSWIFINSSTVSLISPDNVLNEYRKKVISAAGAMENK